jgi:hypothetical protein
MEARHIKTFAFITAILFFVVSSAYGQEAASLSDEEIQQANWLNENYRKALDLILPVGMAASDETINDAPEWILTVRVSPPWDASKFYQLTFLKNFKGSVEATIIMPKGGSISEQLINLRKRNPQATLEEISKLVSVNRQTFTEKERPQLKLLARRFERLKMSPLPPNALILHGTDYYFWVKPYWVNHVEYAITEPSGSYWGNLGKYPHPLAKWAESVRMVLMNNARTPSNNSFNRSAN